MYYACMGKRIYHTPDESPAGNGGVDSGTHNGAGGAHSEGVGHVEGTSDELQKVLKDTMKEFMSGIELKVEKVSRDVADMQKDMIRPKSGANTTLYDDIMSIVNFGMRVSKEGTENGNK